MDIRYRTEKKDYREGGIHLLSLSLCHVELSGEEAYLSALLDFYERWLDGVREACEHDLLPRLREAYMDDPSPRKRFTHRPCAVTCTVTHEYTSPRPRPRRRRQRARVLTFTRRTDVTQGGVTHTLLHDTDGIELTYGCFLS